MFRVGFFVALSATGAYAQDAVEVGVLAGCAAADIQNSCQTTCAVACSDGSFLAENASYCLGLGLMSGESDIAADAAACEATFSPAVVEPTTVDVPDFGKCESEDIFAREECILAKITPECSPKVSLLRGRADLLVTEIQNEVAQYGDLLERDWTNVSNGELLCQFTRDELRDYYQIASENPELLNGLQRQASGIQSCGVEWEEWMRSSDIRNTPNISSELIDQLTREAERNLVPLRSQIENLRVSTETLENAEDSILAIVRLHILSCDAPVEN